MATEVKILTDTISPGGKRITTFVLRFPRYILPELNTHRVFSKNASSSRAIPMSKTIKQIMKDPVIPIHFGANQKGMSANKELGGWRYKVARWMWLSARWPAVVFAYGMNKIGLHKQIGNRILEPWSYISVILTGTEFDNFYKLRCDKDNAHPDIYLLAEKMLECHNLSTPKLSKFHIPYIGWGEEKKYDLNTLFKISVARCCRVSYLNHDNSNTDKDRDIKLYNDLLKNGHMSPFEHQAISLDNINERSGNFIGWKQYRKTINNDECVDYKRLNKCHK